MDKTIVQMNNQYIQDEEMRRRFQEEERRKRNRFMGYVLILVIFLFILPTYSLAQSYESLLARRQQYVDLQERYQKLEAQEKAQSELAQKLKDNDYAAKYARAKYNYSKEGETVYNLPELLPQ